ncbi:MAG: TolC family protein [Magnetococcus sp. WYHC-3]
MSSQSRDMEARAGWGLHSFRSKVALVMAAWMLGGCAVQPEPIGEEEVAQRVRTDMSRMFPQTPGQGLVLGLDEAFAFALEHNLEHRLKRLDEALAVGDVKLARMEMLPEVAASAGYQARNNDPGTESGGVSSVTQEREHALGNLSISWNLLDFGLGYLNARQKADKVLISKEKRRKAIHMLFEQVRQGYWRAVTAHVLLPDLERLLQESDQALARSRRLERLGDQDPGESIVYQKSLLETIHRLWQIQRELSQAQSEFAAQLGLRPGTPYALRGVTEDRLPALPQGLSLPVMESVALFRRPELREEDYQHRISGLDVRRARWESFPGLGTTLGGFFDEDRFLINNTWGTVGLQLSFDLIRLFTHGTRTGLAEMRQDYAEARRLAVAAGVVVQLHLAMETHRISHEMFMVSQQLRKVSERAVSHAHARQQAKAGGDLELIRLRADALLSAYREGTTFAERESALGRIYLSLGYDFLPPEEDTAAPERIIALVRERKNAVSSQVGQWAAEVTGP